MISKERRGALREHIEAAAWANALLELENGTAYEAAKTLADGDRTADELPGLLEMCGLVPAGMPRPGRPPLGTISLSTGYQRPGVV